MYKGNSAAVHIIDKERSIPVDDISSKCCHCCMHRAWLGNIMEIKPVPFIPESSFLELEVEIKGSG